MTHHALRKRTGPRSHADHSRLLVAVERYPVNTLAVEVNTK